ncbi:pentapeptide repeat-containing protein [Streptomyces sp. Tue6028]|uniref:pentapeptide repeat-containing protein n=1 Tax=Streptomyces sp. Tue6028 TaxID=2036037 RepID=UPI003D7160D3
MTVAPTPTWPICGHGGCRGVVVPRRGRCLAHVDAAGRQISLLSTAAGSPADYRGVPFTPELLEELRRRSQRILYEARFEQAVFTGDADFSGFLFSGPVDFRDARFEGAADFTRIGVRGHADFRRTAFEDDVTFDRGDFEGAADFSRAEFRGRVSLTGTRVARDVRLDMARCSGPLEAMIVSGSEIHLTGAVLERPARLYAATPRLTCRDTTFLGPSTLRVRRTQVDLTDANLAAQVSILQHFGPFYLPDGTNMEETRPLGWGSPFFAELLSVRGVDVSFLTVVDMGLGPCQFFGAHHLDQIRITGESLFRSPRPGWGVHGGIPLRWTNRRAMADEHLLRQRLESSDRNRRAWTDIDDDLPGTVMEPAHVAQLYRQLRKALEDSKDEPGAGDFYYGEMEMRRLDRAETTRAERWLLHAYWLLSGYGLRASRALAWLLLAVCVTVVLMLGLGLPDKSPSQTVTGDLPPSGGKVTLEVDTPDPVLTLPVADRFTLERFEKTLRIVLNSVIFRSSGQDLTTWGTYTEMISRFTEPVFLGLAVLAVRGRIKRG